MKINEKRIFGQDVPKLVHRNLIISHVFRIRAEISFALNKLPTVSILHFQILSVMKIKIFKRQ